MCASVGNVRIVRCDTQTPNSFWNFHSCLMLYAIIICCVALSACTHIAGEHWVANNGPRTAENRLWRNNNSSSRRCGYTQPAIFHHIAPFLDETVCVGRIWPRDTNEPSLARARLYAFVGWCFAGMGSCDAHFVHIAISHKSGLKNWWNSITPKSNLTII